MLPTRRKLLTFATALSVVLLVTTCVLWARSYFVADILCRYDGRYLMRADTTYGSLRVELWDGEGHPPDWDLFADMDGWELDTYELRPRDANEPWHGDTFRAAAGGFRAYGGTPPPRVLFGTNWPYPGKAVMLPLWSIVLLSMVLPAFRCASWLRCRRRAQTGHCPACGYDLRATPEQCPECGTVARLIVPSA